MKDYFKVNKDDFEAGIKAIKESFSAVGITFSTEILPNGNRIESSYHNGTKCSIIYDKNDNLIGTDSIDNNGKRTKRRWY